MIYNLIDYIAKENCLQETPEPNSQIFNVLKDIPIYLISNIKKLVDCIQFDFSSLALVRKSSLDRYVPLPISRERSLQ